MPPVSKPWRFLLLNLLVLPGLGSIKAGRRAAGYSQLVLGLTGFAMTLGALLRFGIAWLHALEDEAPLQMKSSLVWWAAAGLVLFFVSWFWALGTSLRVLRKSSGHPPKEN